MNIEYLVEPKLKDLEKKIKELQYLEHIEYSLKSLEYETSQTGLVHLRSGTALVELDSGTYSINFQIQKL